MTKMICIVCPNGCHLEAEIVGGEMVVSGNKCARGIDFAREELTAPKRSLTTTVATKYAEMPVVSVRTNGELPKEKVLAAMKELNKLKLDKKYKVGEVILSNILDTGIDIIVTTDMHKAIN